MTFKELQRAASLWLRNAALWVESLEVTPALSIAANLVTPLPVKPKPKPVVSPSSRLGILCPAYFDPSSNATNADAWTALIEASRTVPVIAIANPADGPGQTRQAGYTAVINRMNAVGGSVVGYVHTKYGTKPPSEVKEEITRWKTLYPGCQGIFFDTTPTPLGFIELYRTYAAHARLAFGPPSGSSVARVVFNWGVSGPKEWGDAIPGAIWVTSEKSGYGERYTPDWRTESTDFAVLRYGMTEAQMRAVVTETRRLGVDWLYATEDAGSNPWDSLSPWFGKMVEALPSV